MQLFKPIGGPSTVAKPPRAASHTVASHGSFQIVHKTEIGGSSLGASHTVAVVFLSLLRPKLIMVLLSSSARERCVAWVHVTSYTLSQHKTQYRL